MAHQCECEVVPNNTYKMTWLNLAYQTRNDINYRVGAEEIILSVFRRFHKIAKSDY